MKRYISNAFSLNMLNIGWESKHIHVSKLPVRKEGIKTLLLNGDGWESVVGHQTTADILGIPCNRVTVNLEVGDELLVAQYVGPRLPEGTTVLPEGATFEFYLVTIS